MSLEKLFNPKSIAIVGASQERGKVGNVITKNLIELGYAGKVFMVNPKHDKLFDHRSYKRLDDIVEKVDLAVIVLPAKIVVPVIREAAGRIKNFVVISAGFSETDEEGRVREEDLKKLAEEKGLNILGPNCLGFIVPRLKLNASFAGGLPEAGNISFVSQSGALAVAIMDIARKENIRFSNIISVGNKMQVDESEILEYLAGDDDTKVIGMYLEGIKDGKKFIEAAEKVSRIKPVVILKAGKTEKAQKAIASHTGALAGSNDIMQAAFEKAGVLQADDLEEFFSLLGLISSTDVPEGKGTAIITNAGGPGVLTTDAFNGKGIEISNLEGRTKEDLRAFLPAESSVDNPIDLLGDAMEDRFEKALAVLGKDGETDIILCVLTPQDQTPVRKITEKIISFKRSGMADGKLVATIFIGGERVEKGIAELRRSDIPNFPFPDRAVSAVDAYYGWNMRQREKRETSVTDDPSVKEERRAKFLEIRKKAKQEKRNALLFGEAQNIMEIYGIKTPWTLNVVPSESLPEKIEFPVVMKVDSDKVLHKTDRQGLVLNIEDAKRLEKVYEQMRNNFPGENFIIQPMLKIKAELILGIKKDSIFGPIVVYGLGGIYTEVFKMVDFLVPPLTEAEIEDHLAKSKIKFLFEKTRGQDPYDIKEMAKILAGLVQLAQEAPEIQELDINPLLVYNDGKEAAAVDVKIII